MIDKELVIAHWERMIAWVKSIDLENLDDINNDVEMHNNIGESWFSNDCIYCKRYGDNDCKRCPLAKKYGECLKDDNIDDDTNINGWIKVNSSLTWREWLINAELFLEQLKTV